jgi:hypothetical protein
VKLRTKELRLFEIFINAPNKIFPKSQLLDRLFSYDVEASENAIEVYVGRLRKTPKWVKRVHYNCARIGVQTEMSVSPPNIQGSIRQRLLIMLLLSAAGIAILLYVVVQSVAEQIAQESQDNILAASAISILDSARVVEGDISIDLPYSSLSMLGQRHG